MTDSIIKTTFNLFKCEKCSQQISIYQHDYQVIACPSCHTIHSTDPKKNTLYKRISNQWIKPIFSIPLYTKGKINGLEVTIIGIALKKDQYSTWREYYLLDQNNDLHILSQWENHFHYFQKASDTDPDILNLLDRKKIINCYKFDFKNEPYKRLSKYNATTVNIVGEFSYDVIDIGSTTNLDFIAPPKIVSFELGTKSELYLGHYLTTKQISKIFPSIEFSRPNPGTVGMAQPFLGGIQIKLLNKAALIFLTLFTVIHLVYVFSINDKVLLVSNSPYTVDKHEIISKPFILPDNENSYYLEMEGRSNLSNQWIENQISLVNEKTGDERELSLGMEYYSGFDNGYSWSEGSDVGEVNLSDVKPGKYHIKQKIVSSSPESHLPFNLIVSTETPANWNYGFITITTIVSLIILNIWNSNFEHTRTGE